jgi:hypothetical protein
MRFQVFHKKIIIIQLFIFSISGDWMAMLQRSSCLLYYVLETLDHLSQDPSQRKGSKS